MITYVRTNLFESNAQVLVNPVNIVGVMGKGLASDFKRLYPEMFHAYQKYCESGHLSIGKLQLFKTSNKWILNFPTKLNWRNPSKIEYIEQGLQKFVDNYERLGIQSISFPMIGCGNGGLDWDIVKEVMERYLKKLPIDIYIHTSKKDDLKPEHESSKEIETWLKSEPSYLSSKEFLIHLKERFGKLIPEVINGMEMSFEIKYEKDQNDSYFVLKTENNKFYLSESELSSIWMVLRRGGLLLKQMLPQELAKNYLIVFLFLSQLDYLSLTRIDGKNNEEEIGLRILPHKQPQKTITTNEFVA
ncbi:MULTISPECIES: macro domain-containing protein [unclassified Sulfurospirillum]|uniref:macro domain-containing protein n=1 Tax=unclassified Sulfurospirillum TaxID=2618290 RepID=UPI00068EFA80|nr:MULTISPECIES: macro domain-containing protein [unclassified Sulfurospirillum]